MCFVFFCLIVKETYFLFFSVATTVISKLFIRVGQDHSRCLDGMFFLFVCLSYSKWNMTEESFSEKCLQILCWGINIPLHNVDFVLWLRRYYMYLQLYTLHHQPRCNYEWSADEVFILAHNNSPVQVQVQVTVLQSWVIHPHMQTHANGQQMRIVQNMKLNNS